MAKIRMGFVSNSSSSSFVIVADNKGTMFLEDGDSEYYETCGSVNISIDELIRQLEVARSNGATTVTITHGGGYNG